mmetsp:Transcript_5392/g.16919  ORF Transcript_5392/g.16919 Transcript_5392/m.16919 type:complete len:202 (+) Transcript_5392:130-735(+)
MLAVGLFAALGRRWLLFAALRWCGLVVDGRDRRVHVPARPRRNYDGRRARPAAAHARSAAPRPRRRRPRRPAQGRARRAQLATDERERDRQRCPAHVLYGLRELVCPDARARRAARRRDRGVPRLVRHRPDGARHARSVRDRRGRAPAALPQRGRHGRGGHCPAKYSGAVTNGIWLPTRAARAVGTRPERLSTRAWLGQRG